MQGATRTQVMPAPSLTGRHGQASRVRLLASKRPMQLSKIRPSGPARQGWHGTGPTKGSPASPRSKRTRARRHRIWDSQPHDPSLPKTRDNAQGRCRPGSKEQPLRCKKPNLAHQNASFKASLRTSPKDTALRRIPKIVPPGASFKTRSPRPLEEEPPFGVRQERCLPAEPQGLEIRARVAGTTPSGKT